MSEAPGARQRRVARARAPRSTEAGEAFLAVNRIFHEKMEFASSFKENPDVKKVALSFTVSIMRSVLVLCFAALAEALAPLPRTPGLHMPCFSPPALRPRAKALRLQDSASGGNAESDADRAETRNAPSPPLSPPPLDLNAAFAARLSDEGGSVGLGADKLRSDFAKVTDAVRPKGDATPKDGTPKKAPRKRSEPDSCYSGQPWGKIELPVELLVLAGVCLASYAVVSIGESAIADIK